MLRDQLLHCVDISTRRTLQNTIGSNAWANMTIAGLMTVIEKAADGKGASEKMFQKEGKPHLFVERCLEEKGQASVQQEKIGYSNINLRRIVTPKHYGKRLSY